MFAHQFRSDLARFWRNPQSRYFTVLMPIVFLVIFATIFKGTTVVDGRRITITTFYVPGIMALGIISATFVNLTQTSSPSARTASSSACAARRCPRAS